MSVSAVHITRSSSGRGHTLEGAGGVRVDLLRLRNFLDDGRHYHAVLNADVAGASCQSGVQEVLEVSQVVQ